MSFGSSLFLCMIWSVLTKNRSLIFTNNQRELLVLKWHYVLCFKAEMKQVFSCKGWILISNTFFAFYWRSLVILPTISLFHSYRSWGALSRLFDQRKISYWGSFAETGANSSQMVWLLQFVVVMMEYDIFSITSSGFSGLNAWSNLFTCFQ